MPIKRISSNYVRLESYFDKIEKEMRKGELRNRKKAVRYIVRKLRLTVKRRYGKDGDLYRGIGFIHRKKYSKVGFGRPAYHAHLIEFGTDERFVRNYMGNIGLIKDVGKINKNPILGPVIEASKNRVEEILSESWF